MDHSRIRTFVVSQQPFPKGESCVGRLTVERMVAVEPLLKITVTVPVTAAAC